MARITKEGWAQLHPKAQWDVTVALRGPDAHSSETLKWFTTGVIRAAVEGVLRPEGGSATINRKLDFIIIPTDGPQYPGSYPQVQALFDYSHFVQHVTEAATIIGIPYYHVSGGVFWPAMKMDPEQAYPLFLEWMEKKADAERAFTLTPSFTKPIEAFRALIGKVEKKKKETKETYPWAKIKAGAPAMPIFEESDDAEGS